MICNKVQSLVAFADDEFGNGMVINSEYNIL